MTEQEQAAAADPRVGDEWILPAAISPLTCNVVCVGDNVQVLYCGEPKYMTKSRFAYWLRKAGWTLAARGPAPAKPSRDPATTPVVGDEWERGDDKITVRRALKSGEIELAIDYGYGCDKNVTRWTVERLANEIDAFSMKLIRRGDDPAWRPEPAKTPPLPHDGKCDYDYAEQTAAGIKVGDRVKNRASGNEGVVFEIKYDEEVGAKWTDGISTWVPLDGWRDWWTIIPPAAAPDPDDTGDEPPPPPFEGDPSKERFMTYQPDPVEEQHYRDDKYIRRIFSRSGNESIDVDIYNVLDAYKTGCPAIDHATKKLLCAGIRGSKSRMQDLREARDSIMRAMEMQYQRETAVAAAKGTT